MARSFTPRTARWTADTETAFLMALRLTGSPVAACAAIGRARTSAYNRRQRCPQFAARWQAVVDELFRTRADQAVAARGSVSTRSARSDGFTPLRRRAFLQTLAETGRYDKACARARISVSAVTQLRRREPAFAAECETAIASGMDMLEAAAVARAVHGVDEPIYRGGVEIGTRRRYADGLLRQLLARQDKRQLAFLSQEDRVKFAEHACQAAGGFFGTVASEAEVELALFKQLTRIAEHKRRGGKEISES